PRGFMKVALVNPAWKFKGSTYFGCTAPHLPLELGYCRSLLQRAGHETMLVDAQLLSLSNVEAAAEVAGFAPEMTVVTTAPSYLFWRCAPPELSVPREFFDLLCASGGTRVVIGPHSSVTPKTTLRKLKADIAVRGECEETVLSLAENPAELVPGVAIRKDDEI